MIYVEGLFWCPLAALLAYICSERIVLLCVIANYDSLLASDHRCAPSMRSELRTLVDLSAVTIMVLVELHIIFGNNRAFYTEERNWAQRS